MIRIRPSSGDTSSHSTRPSTTSRRPMPQVYPVNKGRVSEQMARRRARTRAVILAAKDQPCLDCGARLPPEQMHFHHTGLKRMKIAALSKYSAATVRQELALCVVLCHRCHTLRHHPGGGGCLRPATPPGG